MGTPAYSLARLLPSRGSARLSRTVRYRQAPIPTQSRSTAIFSTVSPHPSRSRASYGLGFERMVMYLTGISNIRDVELHPRTWGNAEF